MAELDGLFSAPKSDLFVEVVSKESDWYTFATFLGVADAALKEIEKNYNKGETIMRRYIEVFNWLEVSATKETPLTWKHIAKSLRRMGNTTLAEKITLKYVTPSMACIPPSSSDRDHTFLRIKSEDLNEIAKNYEKLSERLIILLVEVKLAIRHVNILEIQGLVEGKCGALMAVPAAERLDEIFGSLNKSCSILNFRDLVFVVKNLKKLKNKVLIEKLATLEKDIDTDFKSSVRMWQFVNLIEEEQKISGNDKKLELKVREFWSEYTINQFERVVARLLKNLYDVTSQIRVFDGCICIIGVIPGHIDAAERLVPYKRQFAHDVGVSFLRIVDSSNASPPIEIYKFEGTKKPQTLQEALSRSIDLEAKKCLEDIEKENRDYRNKMKIGYYKTTLERPVRIIADIYRPRYIAFSSNGDMFVTSNDHRIHVYDKNGNKKSTIGSEGSGQLQFKRPYGIDINGDIIYVSEMGNNRIQKLTIRGQYIGTSGKLNSPHDVKISPDGKVYVSETRNNRVQVFHSDCKTISHVIDSSVPGVNRAISPVAIAFDLFGNVHVTDYNYTNSDSVLVFTPRGEFVRQYGKPHIGGYPTGIAIDSSGYSLVTSWSNNTLTVLDPKNALIHSISGDSGLNGPFGIAISPTDGGVWVADGENNSLVKYLSV